MISSEMKKMTENQRALSDLQISKIADLSSDYKFKSRSNEEQFKVNKKVIGKLDDCGRNMDLSEMDKAKENLAEGKTYSYNFISRIKVIANAKISQYFYCKIISTRASVQKSRHQGKFGTHAYNVKKDKKKCEGVIYTEYFYRCVLSIQAGRRAFSEVYTFITDILFQYTGDRVNKSTA